MSEATNDAMRHYRDGTLQLGTSPPLSIYVHLPWCLRKCPYCDFNSHEAARLSGGTLPEDEYLAALAADLQSSLPMVWGRPVVSVFIGGGTPSLFSPASIDRLLGMLRQLLPMQPGCEITLEANPGTFEKDRFRDFREAGVTRLSIGVQSFDDDALRAIGRVHDAAQARAAVEEASACFDTYNLDLMYALPGQGVADLERDLDAALYFLPPHLSLYHLTLEPNTAFARRPPVLPDEDTASDMLDLLATRTAAAGYDRYEVSAYARPNHRCTHNLNYWTFGDYLGIGAGAHSKLSFPHRVVRQVRWREPARYMAEAANGNGVSNEEVVKRSALPFEFMLNNLRLRDGFAMSLFTERTGLPPSAVAEGLAAGLSQGLLAHTSGPDGDHWAPTARGFDFLSDLQALFL